MLILASFLLTLIIICRGGAEDNKLQYVMQYTADPSENAKEKNQTWSTKCPLQRADPLHSIHPEDLGMISSECRNNGGLTDEDLCPTTENSCLKDVDLPLEVIEVNGSVILSIGLNYTCQWDGSSSTSIFKWSGIELYAQCEEAGPRVTLSSVGSSEQIVYIKQMQEKQGLLHVLFQAISNKGLYTPDKVYINRQLITATSTPTYNAYTDDLNNDTISFFPGNRGQIHPFIDSILAFDALQVPQNESVIETEFNYMKSLANGILYPECLCLHGKVGSNPELCEDGTSRFTAHPAEFFLPPQAVSDGLWNAALNYGYWGAPRYNLRIEINFHRPAMITGMEVFLVKQSVQFYKGPFSNGTDESKLIFSVERNQSFPSNGNGHWETVPDQPISKILWEHNRPNEALIIHSLHMVFTGDRVIDFRHFRSILKDLNPIFEIILYGRELEPPAQDHICSCFPGNERDKVKCDGCNRCLCRGGSHPQAGRFCNPYIKSISPGYGPVSGGTWVTIAGGLLQPHIDSPTADVSIGQNTKCHVDRKLATDNVIICRVEAGSTDNTNEALPVRVELLLGEVTYKLKQELLYTYRPDPILDDFIPDSSPMMGGTEITLKGRYLDSVSLQTTHKILTLDFQENRGTCDIMDSRTMVCKLPLIDGNEGQQASIGLILDGVETYKNLTETFPELAQLKIYPQAKITKGSTRFTDGKLTVLGENLDAFFNMSDFHVRVGDEDCKVINLTESSVTCALPDLSSLSNLRIKIEFGGVIYEENRLDEKVNSGVTEGVKAGLGVSGALLTVILVMCGLFFRRKRRTFKRGSNANLLSGQESELEDVRVDPTAKEQPLLEQLDEGMRDIITEKIISCQDFKIQRQIGKGNSGKVFHATLTIADQEKSVALKTLKDTSKASKEDISEFLEEATIMKDFDHPNVLSLIGVIVTEADLYVVLPYMAHGDLRNHVARQMFHEDIFLKFVLDVAEGMKYLSSQRFIHRDLAARNCMVNAEGRVLIGDFGLAKDIYEKDYYTPEDRRRPLPFKWMAPESLERRVFTTKSDVWSFGVTMWEIYTQGDKPYPLIENLDLLMYLQRGCRLEKPPNCPDPLYNVMYLCWHKDPAQRPGFPRLQNEIIQVERDMKQNKKDLIPAISTESISQGEKSMAQSQPTTAKGSSVACKPPMLKPLSRPRYENVPDWPLTQPSTGVQQTQSTAVSTEGIQNKEKSTLQSLPPRVEGSSVACRPPMLKRLSRPRYENVPDQPVSTLPVNQPMEGKTGIEKRACLIAVKSAQPAMPGKPSEFWAGTSSESIQIGEKPASESLRNEGSSVTEVGAFRPTPKLTMLKGLSQPWYENIPEQPLRTLPFHKPGTDVQQRQSTAVSAESIQNKEKSTLQSQPPRIEGSSVTPKLPMLKPPSQPRYESIPEQPISTLPLSLPMEEQSGIEDTDYLKPVKNAQPEEGVNPTEIGVDSNVQHQQSKASTNTQPSVTLRKSSLYEVQKKNYPPNVEVVFENIHV